MRSTWKAFVVGVLGVAAVAGVAAWVLAIGADGDDDTASPPGRASTPGVAEPGDRAHGFDLPALDGGTVRLADFRGRPVVLNFWASWCNPCRKEFPLLAQALEEHDELAVVGVTFRDIESDSRRFAREQGARWPLAVDKDQDVARLYGVRAIPQTFFVGRDGTIAERVFGFSSEGALGAQLTKILRSPR
jgi:cytochrome c biogenesis protein CcmG, thiol:disulfide interchange protein DsbE